MSRSHTFDKVKYRNNARATAKYLNDAFSTEDPLLIRMAIGDMARAHGATRISRKVGMTREDIYRGFRDQRSVAFDTVIKILFALDVQVITKPSSSAKTILGF